MPQSRHVANFMVALVFFLAVRCLRHSEEKEKKTSVCLLPVTMRVRHVKLHFDSANHHRPRERIKNLRFFSLTSV